MSQVLEAFWLMAKMSKNPRMSLMLMVMLIVGSALGDMQMRDDAEDQGQMQVEDKGQTPIQTRIDMQNRRQSQGQRQVSGQGQMQVPNRGQGQMQNPNRGQGQMQNPNRGQGQIQMPNLGQGQMKMPNRGQGQIQVIKGSGYKKCGHFKCVNDPGVVCDRGHNKCSCPKKQVGNGRIKCADPDEACLCTIHGDPHIINFRGQRFILPLPCSHMIADLTTPETTFIKTGCKVVVIGRAWYPIKGREDSIVTYENQIDILVLTKRSRFTARLGRTGAPMTNLTRIGSSGSGGSSGSVGSSSSEEDKDADIQVQSDLDEAGFQEITIPACQLSIKYRGQDGSFSLLTPVRSEDSAGLCGKCEQRWNTPPGLKPPSDGDVLKLLLTSLRSTSPVDGSDINIYPSCSFLTDIVKGCKPNRKQFAFGFCGEMLTNPVIRKWMSVKYGKRNVMGRFSDCFKKVCNGKGPCKEYSDIFTGCPASVGHVTKYLKMAAFCKR